MQNCRNNPCSTTKSFDDQTWNIGLDTSRM
jgi:hypothetical protein